MRQSVNTNTGWRMMQERHVRVVIETGRGFMTVLWALWIWMRMLCMGNILQNMMNVTQHLLLSPRNSQGNHPFKIPHQASTPPLLRHRHHQPLHAKHHHPPSHKPYPPPPHRPKRLSQDRLSLSLKHTTAAQYSKSNIKNTFDQANRQW